MYLPRPFFSPEGETGAAVEAPVVEAPAAGDAAGGVIDPPAGGEGAEAAKTEDVGQSLLSAADSAKAKEAPTEGNEGAASEAAAETPKEPEPITLEPFAQPEGLELNAERLSEFSGLLSDPELSRQELGQKLVDMYAQEVRSMEDAYAKKQVETWNNLNETWKNELRSDPELGGNRLDTVLGVGKAVVEEFGGTAEQQAQLLAHLDRNGMGNFVGFARLMNNIGKALNIIEGGYVPSPATKGAPASRSERWYGGNGKSA